MKAKIEINIGKDSKIEDLLKYLDYLQGTFYADEAATGYPAWKIRLLEPSMKDVQKEQKKRAANNNLPKRS